MEKAFADDAPKFEEISFYAKMRIRLKRVLSQARLETASYDTMVQHLEREMKLNGLANPESTQFTGMHNMEPISNTNQERKPKVTGPCFGCGHQGRLLRNTNRDKCTQDCYSGANWANRPTWW